LVQVCIFAGPTNLTLVDDSPDFCQSFIVLVGDRVTLFAAAVSSCISWSRHGSSRVVVVSRFATSPWESVSRPFAPTVLGERGDKVEGAVLFAAEMFDFGLVAGVEELREMTARFLRVRDFTGVEGVEAVDGAFGEDFFLGGAVSRSSSGSSACLREAD
jgi:hypothetical protein